MSSKVIVSFRKAFFFQSDLYKKLFRTLSKDKIIGVLEYAAHVRSNILESFFKAGFFLFQKNLI